MQFCGVALEHFPEPLQSALAAVIERAAPAFTFSALDQAILTEAHEYLTRYRSRHGHAPGYPPRGLPCTLCATAALEAANG